MLVFVDESGDVGLKNCSSKYFTVTLVLFEDSEEALSADRKINQLRKELSLPSYFEFHFSKLKNVYRKIFLTSITSYEFFYFSIIIDKQKLWCKGPQYLDSFYKYTCGLIFQEAKPRLSNAKVVIDGSGSRKFKQQLSTYLRRRVNDPQDGNRFIREVKLEDSHRNNLLQMADMICGAVARDFNQPKEKGLYRKIISHREIWVERWPK